MEHGRLPDGCVIGCDALSVVEPLKWDTFSKMALPAFSVSDPFRGCWVGLFDSLTYRGLMLFLTISMISLSLGYKSAA